MTDLKSNPDPGSDGHSPRLGVGVRLDPSVLNERGPLAVPISFELSNGLRVIADEVFCPEGPCRLETRSSYWLFRPALPIESGGGSYLRMPKTECPRPPTRALDDQLADGEWMAYRRLQWIDDNSRLRLRVVPANRPETAYGLMTGDVWGLDP